MGPPSSAAAINHKAHPRFSGGALAPLGGIWTMIAHMSERGDLVIFCKKSFENHDMFNVFNN